MRKKAEGGGQPDTLPEQKEVVNQCPPSKGNKQLNTGKERKKESSADIVDKIPPEKKKINQYDSK